MLIAFETRTHLICDWCFQKISRNLFPACFQPTLMKHFKDRIIFMSMYNDIEWGAKGNKERYEHNSQTVASYARKFPRGHWSFLGPGSEEKWYGTYTNKPDGSWNQSAENMMADFSGSGHPTFRASSAFERVELRSKEGGKKSTHIQR